MCYGYKLFTAISTGSPLVGLVIITWEDLFIHLTGGSGGGGCWAFPQMVSTKAAKATSEVIQVSIDCGFVANLVVKMANESTSSLHLATKPLI